MPTYSKETALYDTRAIENDIDEARQTATSYINTVDERGIMVHPLGQPESGWKISSALELLKNGVSYIKAWLAGTNEDIPTVQVGVNNGGHTVIDTNGMRVYGGDGTKQLANIGYGESEGEIETVTDPYYTFGTRWNNTDKGSYSVAAGYYNEASGHCSFAEGRYSRAKGQFSHAQNYGTISAKRSQTVIGQWNSEDTATTCSNANLPPECGQYAFIIGCGKENSPRNAFAVQWNGAVWHSNDGEHDITSYITATKGTKVSARVYKYGSVVQFELTFKNTSSIAGGANVFEGSTSMWEPVMTAMGAGYYGEHALVMTLDPSGNIRVRNASSSAVICSSNTIIRLTYIIP